MLDEKEPVEETETVTETAEETQELETVDYEKELAEQVEKFEKKDANRQGYEMRKAKTEETVETQTQVGTIEEQVAAALAKELPKILPKLQSTIAEDNIETMLNQLAPGNAAKQNLIKFHFENSVGLNGSLRERLENALLIADKKTILKTHKEMAVALQNRQGLSTTGQGSSTEGMQVKDNFLSPEQLTSLKAKGWDDKKIQRFKENVMRNK